MGGANKPKFAWKKQQSQIRENGGKKPAPSYMKADTAFNAPVVKGRGKHLKPPFA